MPAAPFPPEEAAIRASLGPVLIVAGPGAGKTFCLIGRIGHLIDELGVAPERICAVTFTNKAAEEIALRLRTALGPRGDGVSRGTLHALCVTVLREHAETLGIPRGFGIADEPYQMHVLRRLGVRQVRWGQLLTLFSCRRLQGRPLTLGDAAIFERYQDHLRRRHLLDFDDLIVTTAELFRAHPEIARAVAAQWDYVLVDEFQDLDGVQYVIIKALVAAHGNVFVVGDDEQSIFSWRGADPKVLGRFVEDFGIERPIVLDRNRRCSVQVFETARRLLAATPSLFQKDLYAERESPYDVTAYAFEDDDEESAWLIDDLARDRAASGLDWGEYAVLYRRHEVGDLLEGRLLRAGIPCRLARGHALRDDPVVRFVVAALRLMRDPADPALLEAFADVVLPGPLLERVRLTQGDGDIAAALRAFARTNPRAHPDTKRAWRFIYHTENLAAIYRLRDTLAGVVEDLLSQRVGAYRNVLEDVDDELSDPAADASVVSLADVLVGAMDGRRRVWVAPAGGSGIAVKGMLNGAAVTTVDYLHGHAPTDPGDVVVRAGPLAVFKALQLAHSREFRHEFDAFVAFDLETTDDDIGACEIVEIGAVRVRDGQIVDRFHSLVRPARPVSPRATAVHGYTASDLSEAPPFADVWPPFRAFAGREILVAHNGQEFDVPVLRRMTAPLGGADDLVFYDSLLLARSLYRTGARLEDLAHRFGVPMGRAHHALDDAATLAHVFLALNRQRIVRARKSALVNVLDYLALALALDRDGQRTAEREMLEARLGAFALGPYSDCLQFYELERRTIGDERLPVVDEVIELLGGRRRMEQLRSARTAAQRYPEAYARLRDVIAASEADTVDRGIERFLEHVALSTSEGVDVDRHRVNLLTLHSTKGLEFSRVYVVGVEDFQIPGYYQTVDNRSDEIEEARRLLYVGMTRAKDRLVLTRVDRRRGRETGGSRFLREMGVGAVRVEGKEEGGGMGTAGEEGRGKGEGWVASGSTGGRRD